MALNTNLPMGYRGAEMQNPLQALMQVIQLENAQQGNALQRLQMGDLHAQRKLALQQAQEAAQQRARAQNALLQMPSPQMEASQTALAGGGGPTMANAARMPAVDPSIQAMHPLAQAGLIPLADYVKRRYPAPEVMTAAPGSTLFDKNNPTKPLMTVPDKPAPKPSAVQEFEYGQQNPEFNAWQLQGKKAGATSVNVNTGQKGYENESKLRNDFKSEPIYKDYQDMAVAHKQIKAALTAKTPIGDTAAATKIMKLLDPGSVVRESELAIAMAAAGKLDRLQNYLQMKVSGESLTPTQRTDFGALADELFAAAGQAYNAKHGEYSKMAQRYQLDPTSIGAPHAGAAPTATKPAAPIASKLTSQEAVELQQLRARFRGK